MSEDFGTNRIGFATLHESFIANSFRNVLPAVLGKGEDKSQYLPALTKSEHWDKNDGASGFRYRVTRELNNVRNQIMKNIETSSDDPTSPAKLLATECLQHSLHFISELSAYITRLYTELLYSKTFTKEQCWGLVARCVKRCFTDMADSRITARDIKDSSNMSGTAVEYLWATLKTHMVMKEYVSKKFDGHPAFASVITMFVTNNNIQSNVSDLTSRVEKLESTVKTMLGRFDKIYNRLDRLDKEVFKE